MQTEKTEKTTDEFELYVKKGMVLGKNGVWCSIDEALSEEKELNIHLENGEILHEGEWIPIMEAIKYEQKVYEDKKSSDSNRISKKSNKGKKKKGTKIISKSVHKVKKDPPSIKEKKILLADVNIKVDKAKLSKIKKNVHKIEVKSTESKTPVSKANIKGPMVKKETSIEKIKPEYAQKIVGSEKEMTESVDMSNDVMDAAMTQIFKKIPSNSKESINKPQKPEFVSSNKTLVKKLINEKPTFDENITQVIPLPIHLFRGKQIKTKKKNIHSGVDKNRSLSKESLDEWAKIRSNFIKFTILFSVSAILVFICFYLLYYFVLL